MKLLSSQQIRDWDAYTIANEPISSINLMERAAIAFVSQLKKVLPLSGAKIFCGKGNNGGDGLAIARLLASENITCEVFIIEYSKNCSDDFAVNEKRLKEIKSVSIKYISENSTLPSISSDDIIIDAIFGTGLSKPLEGLVLKVVQHINQHAKNTIAVDIPTGLKADIFSVDEINESKIIHANRTFTFQVPKQCFMLAETFPFVGNFDVLDIGLKKQFLETIQSSHFYVTKDAFPEIKQRGKFSHKGTFGHALCIGGSFGKMGATILMSKACLKTGAGRVTAFIPKVGYTILQTAVPECMALTDDELTEIRNFPATENYSAVGVGPGMGTDEFTVKGFQKWLPTVKVPCVIDADGLNICAKLLLDHHDSFHFPSNAIITPHPAEFDRLAGASKSSIERIEKQIHFAQKHKIIVVLKGAHTSIAMPNGNVYFNSTGNPAMATAGSGDVLTGIITALLAQGYSTHDAAILGVYIHGLSGDYAAKERATIIAGDIIEAIPFVM